MVSGSSAYHQQDSGIMTYPGAGWRRVMFRAPIVLWRLGLGSFLGRFLLLVTHTGRKSGLPRRVVVEYHTLDGTPIVPCAFGPRAQWYRNLEADPYVTVQDSDGAQSMQARRITDEEELLAVYAVLKGRNPLLLDRYLGTIGVPNTAEDVLYYKRQVYFIAFEPTDMPTPPPLEADLKWVWGLLLAAHLAMRWWGWRRSRRNAAG
jgi:deazaflavin-dependent oxidoreductase (nitroreductase family)